jgi:hypothetical protein
MGERAWRAWRDVVAIAGNGGRIRRRDIFEGRKADGHQHIRLRQMGELISNRDQQV